MNMKFIPVSRLHLKFVQSAFFSLPKTSSDFDPLPVRQMLCFWSFWSFATKVSSQILKCSTLLTHRVLLRTRTCAPPPQEVPTSSSCRRTTRPMLHCVTSLAEKVAMEVFRGFVKRNLDASDIAAWLLTATISSSNTFPSTLLPPLHQLKLQCFARIRDCQWLEIWWYVTQSLIWSETLRLNLKMLNCF